MDDTQKACCEALDFYFQTEVQSPLTSLEILIINGPPANYNKALKGNKITTINYLADIASLWEKNQVQTKEFSHGEQQQYDLIIQFATKSESENLLHLSLAKLSLKTSGIFIGVVHNKMGTSKMKKLITNEFSEPQVISKSKARVLVATNSLKNTQLNYDELSKPRQVDNTEYMTLAGVYGEKSIDAGSKLLAEHLKKEHFSGNGADIGCGYGYLSGEILKTRHKVKQLHLYDHDKRALNMAIENLKFAENTEFLPHWVDVTSEIPTQRPLHWAIMNPPFHKGITQDYQLGKSFIKQSASILRNGAPLFMVANVHLPYEETLNTHFRSVIKLTTQNGFKCFKAVK